MLPPSPPGSPGLSEVLAIGSPASFSQRCPRCPCRQARCSPAPICTVHVGPPRSLPTQQSLLPNGCQGLWARAHSCSHTHTRHLHYEDLPASLSALLLPQGPTPSGSERPQPGLRGHLSPVTRHPLPGEASLRRTLRAGSAAAPACSGPSGMGQRTDLPVKA